MPTPRRKRAATTAAPEPLVLTGPPGRLRAAVTVANTGDRTLAVRGITVHRPDAGDLPGTAVASVHPGGTAAVQVTVPLDKGTGPGDYPVELEVAGVRRAAVLRVEVELAMRVSPRTVLAVPGRQDVLLRVVNDGNVDVPLAAVVRARTDDGDRHRLDRDDERRDGPDVVLTLPRPQVLTAGGSLELTAVLQVPDDLDPTRRHRARVPVGLADLEVVVLARSNAPEVPS